MHISDGVFITSIGSEASSRRCVGNDAREREEKKKEEERKADNCVWKLCSTEEREREKEGGSHRVLGAAGIRF